MPFPGNWSDEAFDCLNRAARSAVQSARRHPGSPFNPISGLDAEVTYDDDTGYFKIANLPYAFRTLRTVEPDEAADDLRDAWSEEIDRLGGDAYDIVARKILVPPWI